MPFLALAFASAIPLLNHFVREQQQSVSEGVKFVLGIIPKSVRPPRNCIVTFWSAGFREALKNCFFRNNS